MPWDIVVLLLLDIRLFILSVRSLDSIVQLMNNDLFAR